MIIDFIIEENLVDAPEKNVLVWAEDAEEKLQKFIKTLSYRKSVKTAIKEAMVLADKENYIGLSDDLKTAYDNYF